MKSISKRNLFVSLSVLLLLIALSSNVKAQCNYNLSSNLNCTATLLVEIFDYQGSVCNTTPCLSYNTSLNPNGTQAIVCGGCPNICDIQVTVLDISGSPINVTATFTNGFQNYTPPSGCSGTGVEYDAAGSTFKIH